MTRDTPLPRHANACDVHSMRKAAGYSVNDAADAVCTTGRTWRKWEAKEKVIPDAVVKLFCYEVALDALERDPALVGADANTVSRIREYLADAFDKYDPLNARARAATGEGD